MRRIPCAACPARNRNLLCDLPADVLEDFRAAGTTMLTRPRQVLFSEGTPAESLYLVCHGAVKLYHSDRFGRDHILEVAGPGALLGELSLAGGDAMSVSAEAVTEAQIACLPRERLAAFIRLHPETGVRFLAALSRELMVARHKVRELALKSAESRLAGLLLQLADAEGPARPGRQLHLRYTRRELAEMVGVSTETAIRLLAELKRKGVITGDRRELTISDVARLTRIAEHDEIVAHEESASSAADQSAESGAETKPGGV
jgi:CRP-like cAMP-binding protein